MKIIEMKITDYNVIVFDLEIKNEIGKNGVTWGTKDRMGISVGVSYNFKKAEFKVYLDDNIEELYSAIENADIASGFNTLGFDLPLLEATIKKKNRVDNHYDILKHVRHASGMGDYAPGFKLDNHLAGTFGAEWAKTANGSQAPIWYQEGKMGQLISYCLDDVRREAKLLEHIWNHGRVTLDSQGEIVLKTLPQSLIKNKNEKNELFGK